MKIEMKTADDVYRTIVEDEFGNKLIDDLDVLHSSERRDYQSYLDTILKHLAHCSVIASSVGNFQILQRVIAAEAGCHRLKSFYGSRV